MYSKSLLKIFFKKKQRSPFIYFLHTPSRQSNVHFVKIKQQQKQCGPNRFLQLYLKRKSIIKSLPLSHPDPPITKYINLYPLSLPMRPHLLNHKPQPAHPAR